MVEMLAHVLWEAALISLSRRWTHLDWFLYSCSTEHKRIKTHVYWVSRYNDSFLSTRRYLMMVCRPLTCGVLSNTLSVWGSGWFCWAEARSALRPKKGCSDQKVVFFFNRLLKWSSVGLRWQRQHSHQVTKQTHREGEGSVWARQSHKISKVEGKYLTLSSRCIKREGKRQTVRWGKKTQIVRRLP